MYVAYGADLVTTSENKAAADAQVERIVGENNARDAKYASDLAAYNAAVKARDKALSANASAQKAYDKAYADYVSLTASVNANNTKLQQKYAADLAAYNSAKKAYDAAAAARASGLAARASASAPVIQQAGGAPSGYAGCLTQSQRDGFAKKCDDYMHRASTVRGVGFGLMGLGAIGFGVIDNPECVWKNLPLCTTLPTLPANPGSPPKAPTLQQFPVKPPQPKLTQVPAVPQKPVPPTHLDVPTVVVDDSAKRGMVVAGLLAVVVVGGGAAWYFTHKKKKVA